MKDHQDRISQQIGEYRVLHLLGRGAFRVDCLSQPLHEQTRMALKLRHMQLSHREELKHFLNKARAIRLRHPHIMPLLDFGLSCDDLPFLVMEYAVGGIQNGHYPRGTQLPLSIINTYVIQLASALHNAHKHRVIHLDVKPENMLLRDDGTILLSDFGIAWMLKYSSTGSVLIQARTPAYMAPEQSQGKPGEASDQYALATLVYEWIAGRRPVQGTPLEVVVQHRLDAPPFLCALRQEVSRVAEQVIFRAIAKLPDERLATIELFVQALQVAIERPAITTRQLPVFHALSIPYEDIFNGY